MRLAHRLKKPLTLQPISREKTRPNAGWRWWKGLLATRQSGEDRTILLDLAMAAYALGRVPEARQIMQRCLNATPNAAQSDDAKRFLATTALEQPSPDVIAAEPEIQKILKTQPDYVPAL